MLAPRASGAITSAASIQGGRLEVLETNTSDTQRTIIQGVRRQEGVKLQAESMQQNKTKIKSNGIAMEASFFRYSCLKSVVRNACSTVIR